MKNSAFPKYNVKARNNREEATKPRDSGLTHGLSVAAKD